MHTNINGINRVQAFLAILLLKGLKKGTAQITSIEIPSMQTNFKSNRKPIKNAEPEKGLPEGLYRK
jgi:hypothetical protein